MFKLDIPALPAVADGFLDGVNVINGTGHQLFEPTSYQLPLDGFNRDVPDAGVDKTFEDTLAENTTVLFQSYRGMDSPMLLGEDPAELVGSAYDRAESYSVGRKVQELVLSPAAVDITPTPGTAVTNPRLALGLLEQWARDKSTFAPTISGNALALTLIEDTVTAGATKLGTPVILAAGYGTDGPGAAVAGPGQAWLYVHGRVTVWRGPADTLDTHDYRKNRKIALTEASYAASVDSFVAAILVGT